MAIDDLLDEYEQSERVRSWLRKNGAGIIGGVVLGIAVIWGYQQWKNHQARQAHDIYSRYEEVLKQIGDGDLEKAGAGFTALNSDSHHMYATLAALQLARAQVNADKLDDAIATLRATRADPVLQPLVNLRLARLLLQTDKVDEALTVLGQADDSASLEARADALLAQGKRDEARDTYSKALNGLDVASAQRNLIELKLIDAGGSVPKPAEPI
ncbi:MAG: tetratricopeptide repeat protein [Xanthomonadaceae bacterium]|jgi:predicted negative regulator of RcsB-dependent stress response|nr:tetratricopeptide repeat protein [Xanthomonadaceae bacterium]